MNHSRNDNNAIHNRTCCCTALPTSSRIRSRSRTPDTTTSRSNSSRITTNPLEECNHDSPSTRRQLRSSHQGQQQHQQTNSCDVRTVQPKLVDASQFVEDLPKFQFESDWKFSPPPPSSSCTKPSSIPRPPRRRRSSLSLGYYNNDNTVQLPPTSPRRSPRYTNQQQRSPSRLFLGGNRSSRRRNSLSTIGNAIGGNGNSPTNNSPRLSPTRCGKSPSRRRLSITSKLLFRQPSNNKSPSPSKIFRSSTSERTLRVHELYNTPPPDHRLLVVPFL